MFDRLVDPSGDRRAVGGLVGRSAHVRRDSAKVDMETAESIGRNIIGADTNVWVAKVFQAAATPRSFSHQRPLARALVVVVAIGFRRGL